MDNESFTVLPRRITFGDWERVDDVLEAPCYVNNHYIGQACRGEDNSGSFAFIADTLAYPTAINLVELSRYL